MRFRSIKKDEANKEGLHDFSIFLNELISPKSPVYSPGIKSGIHGRAKASDYCFLLSLIKHEHLLTTNENQSCKMLFYKQAARQQMHWSGSTAASNRDLIETSHHLYSI